MGVSQQEASEDCQGGKFHTEPEMELVCRGCGASHGILLSPKNKVRSPLHV